MGVPSPEQIHSTQMSVAQQGSEISEIIFPQLSVPNVCNDNFRSETKREHTVFWFAWNHYLGKA